MAQLSRVEQGEPVCVRFSRQDQAVSLAQELIGLTGVDMREANGGWEVALRGRLSDRLVARVLDAVRRSLGDDPEASATVTLDGHEYGLDGGA